MNYYLVAQGQSHDYELKNHILWSPKETKAGSSNIGYINMAHIKVGDIIFHGYNNGIHAISIAIQDSHSSNRPKGLSQHNWRNTGWEVKLKTFKINFDLNNQLLRSSLYKGFSKRGRIRQIYLSSLSKNSIIYLKNHTPKMILNKLMRYRSTLLKTLKQHKLNHMPSMHISSLKDPITRNNQKSKNKQHHKKSIITPNQSKRIYGKKVSNGILGEYYVCKSLQKQFNTPSYYVEGHSSIFCKKIIKDHPKQFPNIHPNINDSYGCDYTVKDKSKNVLYLIDAKATPKEHDDPFYMSNGEKDLWDKARNSNGTEIYEIYRVYNINKNSKIWVYSSQKDNNGINNNSSAFKVSNYEVTPDR